MPQRPEITSTKNPLVKRIHALAERDAREAEGRMVVEGTRMVEEVLEAGAPVELLLYDPLALAGPRGVAMLERARRRGGGRGAGAPHVGAACRPGGATQGGVGVGGRPRAALGHI